jgi:hypothetical protein
MDYRGVEPGALRWDAGLKILDLTDSLGFSAQAAGWVYVPESDQWRYYLITQMVDEKGPRWIYERLLKIFAKVHLPPGITPLDIYIGSPKDSLFRALKAAGVDNWASDVFKKHRDDQCLRIDVPNLQIAPDVFIARALFYRLDSHIRKPNYKLFDKKVEHLLAA